MLGNGHLLKMFGWQIFSQILIISTGLTLQSLLILKFPFQCKSIDMHGHPQTIIFLDMNASEIALLVFTSIPEGRGRESNACEEAGVTKCAHCHVYNYHFIVMKCYHQSGTRARH